jgi:hypothetical protein
VTGLGIAYSLPQRFLRFSLVGSDFPVVQARINRVRYDLRALGLAWEDTWVVERNPKGTGFHAHLWQHGSYVRQDVLQEVTQRRGMGIPWIQAWRAPQGASVTYGLKSITYGLKGARGGSEGLTEHLTLNGGRLIHASRGFWRNGATGERLTKRKCEQDALTARQTSGVPSPWILRHDVKGNA